jgi:shikimate 5-dehydrogenase
MDYVNNLKVYEAIVESKILETTKKQIENLEKKAEIIINDTSVKMKQPMPMPQAVAPGVQYVPSNVGAVQLPPPIPRPTN